MVPGTREQSCCSGVNDHSVGGLLRVLREPIGPNDKKAKLAEVSKHLDGGQNCSYILVAILLSFICFHVTAMTDLTITLQAE